MSALDKLFGGILSAVSPTYEANRPQEEFYKSLIGNQVEDFGGVTEAIKKQKELDKEVEQQVKELEKQNNLEFKDPDKKENIKAIRVNLVEDPEKKTGIAGLNINGRKKMLESVNLVNEPKENVTDKSEQSKETVVEKPTKFEFKSSNTLTDFLTGAEGFIPTVTEAIESKLNPKLDKTYDIGYGHKLSSEEYKSGLVYGIKVKDDKGNFIPISKEDALKILNEDIKEKGRITKVEYENQTGKKFSDLSKTIQELLVESTFNGLSPKKAPGLTTAASKNDIKGIVDNMTDRYTGPKGKRVILGDRNKRLWSSYLDKLSQNLSKQDYGQLKNKVLIERQPKKKQSGGMIESDPYKRQPRFI